MGEPAIDRVCPVTFIDATVVKISGGQVAIAMACLYTVVRSLGPTGSRQNDG